MIVEAPVLDGDDGLGEVRAETFETDGLTALGDRDLPYLVPVNVVYVRVLGELGVGPVEVVFVLSQDEQVEAGNAYRGGYAEDENKVEERA